MKIKIPDESYKCPENASFKESKTFKAEDYTPLEMPSLPKEMTEVPEISVTSKPKEETKKPGSIEKLVENVVKATTNATSLSVSVATVAVGATAIGVLPSILDNEPKGITPPFTMVLDDLIDTSNPGLLSLEIPLSDYRESPYEVFVLLYDENQNLLKEEEAETSIDGSSLFVQSPLRYGTKEYQIRLKYEGEETLTSFLPIDVNQEYQASYRRISPNECTLTYSDTDSFDLVLKTDFQTDYPDIFLYEISLFDESGSYIDSYRGNEGMVTFSSLSGFSSFSIEYRNIGIFDEEEHTYDSFSSERVTSPYAPKFKLGEVVPMESSLTLSYDYIPVNEEMPTRLRLHAASANNGEKTIEMENINGNTLIPLDELGEDPGLTVFTPEITFYDNQSEPQAHTLTLSPTEIDLSYSLSVNQVIAYATNPDDVYISVSLELDSFLPLSYSVAFSNNDGDDLGLYSVNEAIDLENAIPSSGGELRMQVISPEGAVFKEYHPITFLSLFDAQALKPSEPYFTSLNPADAVLTYNEDGTVNLYRDLTLDKEVPEGVYCDAFVYSDRTEIGDQKVYVNPFHHLSNKTFVALEDLPMAEQYRFIYYTAVYNEGIYYYLSEETPSGSVDIVNEGAFPAVALFDETLNQTEIRISGDYLDVENRIIVDEEEYAFTDYNSTGDYTYSLIVRGDKRGKPVTIFASKQSKNYEEYSASYVLKGNKYLALNITPESA